jgi:hypothetical protein
MKIINLGLPKTGTTTLVSALQYFHLKRGFIKDIYNPEVQFFVGDYVHQKPIEEWFKLFPDDIFLLTVRRDPQVWMNSLLKWAEKKEQNKKIREFRKKLYGYEMPHGHEDHFMQIYEEHNYKVLSHAKRHNLTLLCWELGDEWKKLCRGIKMPVPNRPFPHLNKQIY